MSATELGVTPPAAEPGEGLKLVLPGRGTSVAAGWDWIVEGWKLFARAPLMWIISIVILFVLAIVVSLVPIIGSLAFQLLNAVLAAGFVVACRSLERGADFELEHLFAGFKNRFTSLLLVGLFFLLGGIAILLVFAFFVGFTILAALMTGNPESVMTSVIASGMSIALGTLVTLGLTVPLMAAFWFAPALVIMHDVPAAAAMKESFFACFRNFVPFLVYSLVMLVFAIVALIPFGLGMLVWVPVTIASTYVAYRQIFTEDDAPAAPVRSMV